MYFNSVMKILYSAFLVLCSMVLLGTAIDFVKDFCFRKENRIVVESIDKYGENGDLRKMSMKHGMNHNDVYIIYR